MAHTSSSPTGPAPAVTHKRFSNLRSDIDGALCPAAASLRFAAADVQYLAVHSLNVLYPIMRNPFEKPHRVKKMQIADGS